MNQLLHKHNRQHINLAELLDRDVVPLRTPETYALLRGQVVLVTGAAGSIGSELCRLILNDEPECLIALDNNETGLFDLTESVRTHPFASRLHTRIGDITNKQGMRHIFAESRPRIVFHAAAYKHVPLLERHPIEAIRTNVLATYSLCRLARESGVARFVFISSDKAAEPVSILGASKRLGELIIHAQGTHDEGVERTEGATCFSSVRFGNVMGSRGSVIPIFAQQIEQGGPVTVTHPDATRYFMTIPEACGLVILTAALAERGGLYLLDMGSPVRILDLATKMIRHQRPSAEDIAIVYTGLRPGECLHEKLTATDEELQPTSYRKIFCVNRPASLPTHATIAQWMHMLEKRLYQEDVSVLRNALLAMARSKQEFVAPSPSSAGILASVDALDTLPVLNLTTTHVEATAVLNGKRGWPGEE